MTKKSPIPFFFSFSDPSTPTITEIEQVSASITHFYESLEEQFVRERLERKGEKRGRDN